MHFIVYIFYKYAYESRTVAADSSKSYHTGT